MKRMMKINVNIILLIFASLFLSSSMHLPSVLYGYNFSDSEKNVQNHFSDEIRMIAVGDVMLSREVERKMLYNKNFKYPFLKTAEITNSADIVFGNLETPIIAGRQINESEMVFRTDPKSIAGLKYAGFNVLSLANNHMMNFGKTGLRSTLNILDENEILHIGAGIGEDEIYKQAKKEIKGTKFSFLGFTYNIDQRKSANGEVYGLANMDLERMKGLVQKAALESDVVIVSMHAGIEYQKVSSKFQENFARSAIDAGAEIVIGHHPHVVQNVEKYNGGYIIYSLGNFVFDQMWSNETRLGVMAEITFQDKKIKKIEFIPVKIFDYAQPVVLKGEEKKMILKRLKW